MKKGIVFEVDNLKAVVMNNEGEFLSIPAKSEWKVGEEISYSELDAKRNEIKHNNRKRKHSYLLDKRVIIAMIASLLFFIIPLTVRTEASSFVTLDINPSIEMELKHDKVVNIRPLNNDAKAIVDNINQSSLEGSLYDVTAQIIDKAEELGYLKKEEENVIMVGVLNSKDQIDSNDLEQYIQNKLTEKSLNGEVLVLNATKKEKKLADDKGVSLGKYLLQAKEQDEGITITDEQLNQGKVKDLMKRIKEEKKNQGKGQQKKVAPNDKANGNKQDGKNDKNEQNLDKNNNNSNKQQNSSTNGSKNKEDSNKKDNNKDQDSDKEKSNKDKQNNGNNQSNDEKSKKDNQEDKNQGKKSDNSQAQQNNKHK